MKGWCGRDPHRLLLSRRASGLPSPIRHHKLATEPRTLHRLKLSWKKARKLLGRAKPEQREGFIAESGPLWRWLHEDGNYHHCYASTDDLIRRVAALPE